MECNYLSVPQITTCSLRRGSFIKMTPAWNIKIMKRSFLILHCHWNINIKMLRTFLLHNQTIKFDTKCLYLCICRTVYVFLELNSSSKLKMKAKAFGWLWRESNCYAIPWNVCRCSTHHTLSLGPGIIFTRMILCHIWRSLFLSTHVPHGDVAVILNK